MSHATNYSEPLYTPSAGYDDYPESEEGWVALYDWRIDNYLMRPYSASVARLEHLFRAFDDGGNEIDQTRRIFDFCRFIVDTDARALTGGGLTLETYEHAATPSKGKDATLMLGETVWHRARLGVQAALWGRMTCALGDYWLEAVRLSPTKPHRTTIVAYDPRTVSAVYDLATGTELERIEINSAYTDSPMQAERNGAAPGEVTHSYRRVVTRTDVTVWRDGKEVPGESGPHALPGHVPIVQLRAIPFHQPEHSLSACGGIERAVMRIDGLTTQNFAIGNRFGNPMLLLSGFKIGAEGARSAQRFGRMIDGAPADAKGQYITVDPGILPHLLEQQRDLVKHIRDTAPEFLFASDSAQESAEARSLRGQSFEMKLGEMRQGFYCALVEVLAMAVAMDGGPKYDPDHCPFKIDAPPILPRGITGELDSLLKVRTFIKGADFVRGLQRLGMVDNDEDPVTYHREVMDEQALRATAFFEEEPEPGEGAAAAKAQPAADVAEAPKAYNGIQITAASDILAKVADGTHVPDLGVTLLVTMLLIDEPTAREMVRLAQLGDVVEALAVGKVPAVAAKVAVGE